MKTLRTNRSIFTLDHPNVSGIAFMYDEIKLTRIEFTLIEKRWHHFDKMRENDLPLLCFN